MPMDFLDLKSLERAAKVHGFRAIRQDETEAQYRIVLADYVEPKDFIESQEIRNKVGWHKWSDEQNRATVMRKFRSL